MCPSVRTLNNIKTYIISNFFLLWINTIPVRTPLSFVQSGKLIHKFIGPFKETRIPKISVKKEK